jgi:hypothetical protein
VKSKYIVLGCALLLVGLAGCGSKKHTIKTREPQEGDVHRVETTNSFDLEVRLVNVKGDDSKTIKSTKSSETMVYTSEVLKLEGGKPVALRRQYEKAEAASNGNVRQLPFHGKTVLIEKRDGKFQFRFEGGGELSAQDAGQLLQEFGSGVEEPAKLLLPPGPVSVGETWKLPIDKIAANYEKTLPVKLDAAKATGSGKLARAYDQNGKAFGVLQYQVEMPVKGEMMEVPAGPGSKLTLEQKTDGCIDGSSDTTTFSSEMKLEVKGMLDVPPKGRVTVMVDGKGTYTIAVTELPKK